jgi:hypothetical protein
MTGNRRSFRNALQAIPQHEKNPYRLQAARRSCHRRPHIRKKKTSYYDF